MTLATSRSALATPEGYVEDQLSGLVEELGLVMEANGYPRMVGRTLGQLMLSPQPQHSQAELAQILNASVASISAALRHLVDLGYVERAPMRGLRSGYYRMAPHVWPRGLDRSLPVITRYREFAERALEALPYEDHPSRETLEEMREFMIFIEREIPALIKKFTEMRGRVKATATPSSGHSQAARRKQP